MSAVLSDSTYSDGDRHRSPTDGPTDRSQPLWKKHHEQSAMATTVGIGGTGGNPGGGDISASQKMISATWGSVLTSLLGMNDISIILIYPEVLLDHVANGLR